MGFFVFKKRRFKSKLYVMIFLFFVFTCYFFIPNLLSIEINVQRIHKTSEVKNQILFKKENLSTSLLAEKILNFNSNLTVNNFHFIEKILEQEYLDDHATKTQSQFTTKYVYKSPKFFVILVQVHSRLNYLKELINSLRQTKYIEQTLVIFSHDFYDQEINLLIKSIDFCATLQIFYPFSIQIYPNKYPGTDPNDCPKNIAKEKAKQLKCLNAEYPDTFGHYRESSIVQIKHHWFWKLNYVFEKLKMTKNLQNLHVLLLEEDHYVFQDSIHVIRQLTEKILSDVDVVSLGYFKGKKQQFENQEIGLWSKGYWWASSNNIGLLVSRNFFDQIKNCSKMFCEYDDYNWDWSLQYINQKCFKNLLVSIYPTFSRIAHLGECGTHFKSEACDPKVKLNEMKQKYNESPTKFFPKTLDFKGNIVGIRRIKKSNGGWSDPRDHNLCKSFVSN